MKKKLLITGGSGYLGINLALTLKKKYKVFIGSRNQKRNYDASKQTGCEAIPLDVTNINSIRDALIYCKPDVIIHAAATKFVDISEKFPFECSDVNILGSVNLARVAIERGVKTVIGISTDKATQPLKNFYGFSKATMEKLFLNANSNSKTNFLCVRYGNVAWSTGSVLPIWKNMFTQNRKILTTGPNMRRFFFSITDAVNLVVYALTNSITFKGKIVCADMKSCKLIDIIKIWNQKHGGSYQIIKSRKGDRQDEYLIGLNEIDHTSVIIKNKKKYYVIDFEKKSIKPPKNIISSKNVTKLNHKEISEIIDLGMNQ
ncbi:polysaccharide biosynthesis protein [Candidatus Pelagibacter sp.]|nr:polysaccharide biosynthesis protein [Candidatus Pelagibacter sp.]